MIVVTGHSRSGTKYTSHLLWSMGYQVHHERLGPDGIVAWQLGADGADAPWNCPPRPYGITLFLQVVRDPFDAIPSIVGGDFGGESMGYRRRYVEIPERGSAVEVAACSYLRWNRMIEKQAPDLTFRVEDAADALPEFFGRPAPDRLPPRNLNSRPHPEFSHDYIQAVLSDDVAAELSEFCARYYPERLS